jgi:hypothetical protein
MGMDKYGNKFFENLEEELPRKLEVDKNRGAED